MKGQLRRWLFVRGGLIAIVALVVYAAVAPSHLSTGDNAEFAALSYLGGAAHPPGYPLYVLWLRAWSWLPGQSPAHVAALATCLLGATMLLVLHAACRAWGASVLSASLTVAMVGAAPLAVRLHTEAEVFALNGLVGALIIWLSARRGRLTGYPRTAALGFVAGLGLANHHTCVLLTPLGLLGVARGARESRRPGVAVAITVGTFVLGLTPYLYLLVAQETRASWGHVDGGAGLVHHFLRIDYGGPGQLGPVDRGGTAAANLFALAATLLRSFLWVPCAVALVIVGLRLVRPSRDDGEAASRLDWMVWLATFLLAGPVFVARFNLPPEGPLDFITRRFHLLPTIVLAVPVACGLQWTGDWIRRRLGAQRRRAPWGHAAFASLVMTGLIGLALPGIARARSPAIEQALRNMLQTLPRNAVLIGTPDELNFGMAYLQGTLHERPDVVVITWQLVGLPHVRKRIAKQLGIEIRELPEGADKTLSVVVAEQILASGRPLFIDSFQGNIAASFPVYPVGLLYRVLPRGSALPTIDELFEINQRVYETYRFGYEFPHQGDVVPALYHRQYAGTWRAIAAGLRREGKSERALAAEQMAQTLEPAR